MAASHHLRPRRRAPDCGEPAQTHLDGAVAGVGLVSVYQPIVSLADLTTVGYEALSRWPDLLGCSPAQVFDHASRVGTADVLDQLCIDSAIVTAMRSPLRRRALLCVNAEPSTGYVGRADDAVLALGHAELTVMFEITERSPLAHPRSLLQKVAALRADGFAIALDDVGVHPHSVALLDVIRPDVVKLDLALIQTQPSRVQARTLAAVLAHHERTGAVILAEGIETDEHLGQAMAVGATLGQGYLFGRPEPLVEDVGTMWTPPAWTQAPGTGGGSPFDMVADALPVRAARRETLTALSHHIEDQAARAVDPPMVFTALQRNEYFTGATRDRYRQLAGLCPLVAVFGLDVSSELGAGVRGVRLNPADPMCAEWTVIALGPHHAAALIAREQQDECDALRPDADRRFDFVITYDRALVTAAARNLLHRML